MKVKALEVRDSMTFIPVLAVNCNPSNAEQRYLLRRLGYPCDGVPNILLTRMDANGGPAWNDPFGWPANTRTMPVAHGWIMEHWYELEDGDVVDVEFILGETKEKKDSERVTVHG